MAGFFIVMFYCYIIYSVKIDKFYVGQTEDLDSRLIQHNSALSIYTSKTSDWQMVYSEKFDTRELALKREVQIKKKKSRKYIEWLIGSAG